mmetsp:Transcript_25193/g.44794  ORF Transcript_25193/g.44794 Transcript_25193/m.44794 type:complete len:246 (-) Transcript_25193:82-819(-)
MLNVTPPFFFFLPSFLLPGEECSIFFETPFSSTTLKTNPPPPLAGAGWPELDACFLEDSGFLTFSLVLTLRNKSWNPIESEDCSSYTFLSFCSAISFFFPLCSARIFLFSSACLRASSAARIFAFIRSLGFLLPPPPPPEGSCGSWLSLARVDPDGESLAEPPGETTVLGVWIWEPLLESISEMEENSPALSSSVNSFGTCDNERFLCVCPWVWRSRNSCFQYLIVVMVGGSGCGRPPSKSLHRA